MIVTHSFEEPVSEDEPSLSSVIRQKLSLIMAPPEDQFQQIAWPENAEIYQPYESNQILLPDSSACLAIRTFLHMNELHFKVIVGIIEMCTYVSKIWIPY